MKIIRVDSCQKCPYCSTENKSSVVNGALWTVKIKRCDRYHSFVVEDDKIPDWCPLEEEANTYLR